MPAPVPSPSTTPADTGPKVKVGGQLRVRPEYRNGLKPDPLDKVSDTLVGQRARASVAVGADKVKAFVEVQDARNWGTETSTVSNDHNADLHQAYVGLTDVAFAGTSVTLGRQELIYGDERLLGALDWATTARSFDGGVVRYGWKNGAIDGLAALVNDRKTAARGTGDMILSGVYGRFLRGRPGRELDLYALNLRDGARIAGEVTGLRTSRITTVGARARSAPATGFQASAEGAWQFGHRGPDDHSAYAWAAVAGWTFATRYRPAVRVEWDGAGGDADPKDGRSREFNNLYPTNHPFYGYADLLGWRNMNALRGTLALAPHAGHLVSLDVHRFRLRDAKGAWKDASGEVLGQDVTGNSGRDIGDEMDVLYRFPVRKELACLVGYSAFFPGPFAKTVRGAKTQSFGYAQLLFKF
jgi:hypothetical protein